LVVSDILRRDGQFNLATLVDRFLQSMPPPQTERERIAARLQG
jgi:hypothetical protein